MSSIISSSSFFSLFSKFNILSSDCKDLSNIGFSSKFICCIVGSVDKLGFTVVSTGATGIVDGAITGVGIRFLDTDIIGGTSLGGSEPNSDISSVSIEIGFLMFFCKEANTPICLFILSVSTQLAPLCCNPYISFNNASNSSSE